MPLMSTGTPLIESILLAAGLPDAEISARLADIGPDNVAKVMLAEVAGARWTLASVETITEVVGADVNHYPTGLSW
jgi:hypothetical protein